MFRLKVDADEHKLVGVGLSAKLLEKSYIHDHKINLLFSKEGPVMTF